MKINPFIDIRFFVFISLFWVYGFMAYGTAESLGLAIRVAIEILLVFSCFTFLDTRQNILTNIRLKSFIVALAFTSILAIGMTMSASSDLSGDETAHLRSAHIIAIKLGSSMLRFPPLAAANAELFYRIVTLSFISFFLVTSALIWDYYSKNRSERFFVPVLIIEGIRFLMVIATGGNGEPYPQLRNLINGVVTSIFGFNRFAICLIGISSLTAMLFYLYNSKYISRAVFYLAAYLLTVLFVSGSLFWGVFYLEQSIFTFSVITPLLLRLTLSRSKMSSTEGLNWLTILALSCLIRSVIVVPLLLLSVYLVINKIVRGQSLLKACSILSIAIPSTLQLIYIPSNARYTHGFANVIGDNQFLASRLLYYLKNGVVIDIISRHSGLLVICVYTTSAILVLFATKASLRVIIFWVSLQFLMLVSFFSLRTDHLGIERYQIEYVLPFFFSAVIAFASFVCDKLYAYGFQSFQITGSLVALSLSILLGNKKGDVFSFKELLLFPRSYSTIKYYTTLNSLIKEDPARIGIFGTANSEPALAAAGLNLRHLTEVMNNNKHYHTSWVEPTAEQIFYASKSFRYIVFIDAPWEKKKTVRYLTSNGWTNSQLYRESQGKIGELRILDSFSGDRKIFDNCKVCTESRSTFIMRR